MLYREVFLHPIISCIIWLCYQPMQSVKEIIKISLNLSKLYKNSILEFRCHFYKNKDGEQKQVNLTQNDKFKWYSSLWQTSYVIDNWEIVESLKSFWVLPIIKRWRENSSNTIECRN